MDLSIHPRPRTGLGDRALLALAGIAFVASALGAASAHKAAGRARAAASEAERATAAAEERIRALASRGPGDAERLAARVELNAEAPLPRVLGDLSGLMPDDVRLLSLTVTYGDEVILEAAVEARTAEAWDAFLDRLAGSRRFHAVSPGPERREGEIRASLRMAYRGDVS